LIRTYTYKLYSNRKVERKFYQWLGTCRYVYNMAKATKEAAYEAGVSLSGYDLQKQLTPCKKEDELSFLNTVHSQTLQATIERLDKAYKNFFSKRANYPKWASKRTWKSFGFKKGTKQTKKGFKLPKFGEVKVHNNRKIDGKIKTARLVKKADGIYLQVVSEVENRTYSANESQVGIDMGISYFLTTSDGEFVDNPKFLEKQLKKLRVEQRSLSRKVKGSNRWKRQAGKVSRLHKKVTDARTDFLHKLSTRIATEYSDIAIEKLNIKGMVKGNLSRHINDVSWGKFFEMLEYKANTLVRVDPKYTSQECSSCGHTAKENRLTQSQFKCVSCGYEANADWDAAKVIMGRAFPNSRKRRLLDQA